MAGSESEASAATSERALNVLLPTLVLACVVLIAAALGAFAAARVEMVQGKRLGNGVVVTAPSASPPALALTRTSVLKALLIGINYEGTPDELAGCVSDIQNIERVLRANGCNDVVALSEAGARKPTRANIEAAFADAVQKTKAGDVLFVHYSGHGGQVPAPAGRFEPSRTSSTLVPLDYKKAGQIPDHVFKATVLDALVADATLFMVVDACHSGTIGDLRYNYADASFRQLSRPRGFGPPWLQALQGGNDASGAAGPVPLVQTPAEIAHEAAHAFHRAARRGAASPSPPSASPPSPARASSANSPRLEGGASDAAVVALEPSTAVAFAEPYTAVAFAEPSSAVAARGRSVRRAASPPPFARYYKPDVSYADHVKARERGERAFAKSQGEWRARDVKPVEDTTNAPTAANIFLVSGCRDSQTSADTAFDGQPQGACTHAFLCALCGSVRSTKIQPVTLRDLLKCMRGTLASSGYTQVPQLSCGRRVAIDELTVRDVLKLP